MLGGAGGGMLLYRCMQLARARATNIETLLIISLCIRISAEASLHLTLMRAPLSGTYRQSRAGRLYMVSGLGRGQELNGIYRVEKKVLLG